MFSWSINLQDSGRCRNYHYAYVSILISVHSNRMGVVDSRCLVGCGNHMRIKVLRTDELVMVREVKSSTLLISKSDRKTFT
jgi:hypothetical protein